MVAFLSAVLDSVLAHLATHKPKYMVALGIAVVIVFIAGAATFALADTWLDKRIDNRAKIVFTAQVSGLKSEISEAKDIAVGNSKLLLGQAIRDAQRDLCIAPGHKGTERHLADLQEDYRKVNDGKLYPDTNCELLVPKR